MLDADVGAIFDGGVAGYSAPEHARTRRTTCPFAQLLRHKSHTTRYAADHSEAHDDDRGYGWVAFAGTLVLMPGTLDLIEGIAAIGNSRFFVKNTHYIVGNLNTWG